MVRTPAARRPEARSVGLIDDSRRTRTRRHFARSSMSRRGRARARALRACLGGKARPPRARRASAAAWPITAPRNSTRMRMNFYGFDPSYHIARHRFVYRTPHAWTPLHLAQHRRALGAARSGGCMSAALEVAWTGELDAGACGRASGASADACKASASGRSFIALRTSTSSPAGCATTAARSKSHAEGPAERLQAFGDALVVAGAARGARRSCSKRGRRRREARRRVPHSRQHPGRRAPYPRAGGPVYLR